MNEEQEEQYLRDNGWFKINQTLWNHKDCNYDCCHELAIDVQKLRDKENKPNKFVVLINSIENLFVNLYKKVLKNENTKT